MKLLAMLIAAIVLQSCTITGNIAKSVPSEEHFNYSVKFCGSEDCLNELLHLINSSGNDTACALYNADRSVLGLLQQKNATIIVDKNAKTYGTEAIRRNNTALMHNKFCVFERKIVWTGSFNPVRRSSKDDVIIINSTILAKNYLDEFEELKGGSGGKTTTSSIILNNTLIESYFCPEDCKTQLSSTSGSAASYKIIDLLDSANESIYFMTYSFTHPKIANALVLKRAEGVDVKGIIEKSTTGSKYSKHEMLASNGVDLKLESTSALLHYKVFIIDKRIVITGSMNPTESGIGRNDENVLIIHNEEVAGRYLEEFEQTPINDTEDIRP